jgi:hypothetical protein
MLTSLGSLAMFTTKVLPDVLGCESGAYSKVHVTDKDLVYNINI